MRKPFIVLLAALLLLGPIMSRSAPAEGESAQSGSSAPTAGFEDRGAGYLPYSDPSPFGSSGFLGAVARTAFSLVVVLGLLYAILWFLKKVTSRSGTSGANESIRVMGRLYLNPKTVIYFVKLGDELLVVGTNAGNIALLAEIREERRIVQIENALKGSQSPVSGMPFSRFFDKSLLRFQKTLEKDDLTFDEQIHSLDDRISRLKGLSRKRRSSED